MKPTGIVASAVAFLVLGAIVIAALFGFFALTKSFNRYQKRADAENNVRVTQIQIKNQRQRVQIARQKAEIRFQDATGIRRAQDEIALTLTPFYLQHEMIQAMRESGASTIYIPTDPATGLPVVTTRNAGGK